MLKSKSNSMNYLTKVDEGEKAFSYPSLKISGNEFEPSELIQIDTELSIHEIIGKEKNSIENIVIVGAWRGDEVNSFLKFKNVNIFCFEPNPQNFSFLQKRFNDVRNVHCFPLACGAMSGEAELFESNITGTDSMLPILESSSMSLTKKHSVTICRLDDVTELKGKAIDLLWIDVQGFELEVLKGANALLQNCQAIFTEVNENNPDYKSAVSYATLTSYLISKNFRLLAEGINKIDMEHPGGNALFVQKQNNLSGFYFDNFIQRIQTRVKWDSFKRNIYSIRLLKYLTNVLPNSSKILIKKYIN